MANAVVNKILDFLGVDNGEAQEDDEMLDNEYTYTYDQDEEELDEAEEELPPVAAVVAAVPLSAFPLPDSSSSPEIPLWIAFIKLLQIDLG